MGSSLRSRFAMLMAPSACVTACTLLAPSDQELQGDATVPPATSNDAGPGSPPDGSGSRDAEVPSDSGTSATASCAICQKLSGSCVTAPSCECIGAVCGPNRGCGTTANVVKVSCPNEWTCQYSGQTPLSCTSNSTPGASCTCQ